MQIAWLEVTQEELKFNRTIFQSIIFLCKDPGIDAIIFLQAASLFLLPVRSFVF